MSEEAFLFFYYLRTKLMLAGVAGLLVVLLVLILLGSISYYLKHILEEMKAGPSGMEKEFLCSQCLKRYVRRDVTVYQGDALCLWCCGKLAGEKKAA